MNRHLLSIKVLFLCNDFIFSDISPKDVLINVFALASRLGVAISWLSIAVLTTEIYPTVVR